VAVEDKDNRECKQPQPQWIAWVPAATAVVKAIAEIAIDWWRATRVD